ncbi:hypothetical protein [Aestuariirhabdus sp. LZHN29]|uniref:hypothetical protein n=1 Tax=Aestuariirhabdus sp. LZHN29 TaxID=3417462 RepID=UPI003CE68259
MSGVPRSGTSWLAKTLSLCKGVDYYFEPDEALGPDYYDKYLAAGDRDDQLLNHLQRSLGGRVVNEYAIAEKGLREIIGRPFADVVLVKWVRMSLALEFFGVNFPDVPVVQLVRHPVPQFLSWRQRGWDPQYVLQGICKQEVLINGPLRMHAKQMKAQHDFWGSAATLWGVMTTMQLRAHRPQWILKEHEWYCTDPIPRMRWLIETLGLSWTERAEEFLSPNRSKASGPGYGGRRDPAHELSKWRSQITQQELHVIASALEPFELPFYPNLNPETHWEGQ